MVDVVVLRARDVVVLRVVDVLVRSVICWVGYCLVKVPYFEWYSNSD